MFVHKLVFNLDVNIKFENIAKGRKGAILVGPKNDDIPIVRSTTIYKLKPAIFNENHKYLIREIKKIKNVEFNNAMLEYYSNTYKTMGYHSDQELDLADDSYICIFTSMGNRILKIKSKETSEESEIHMKPNTLIIFDLNFNRKYWHKIELSKFKDDWIGITLRKSKTYIRYIDEIPYFVETGEIVEVANEAQKKEYYELRSLENKLTNFKWPTITYNIGSL